MRPTLRTTLAAGALIIGGVLGVGATWARAQAAADGAYRGPLPGYYYSPGGYSGGYYFNPGYYRSPAPRATTVPAARGYLGSSTAVGSRNATSYNDYSTGRTNISVPLAKPWLRPLR